MGIMHLVTLAVSIWIATYILPGVDATYEGIAVLTIVLLAFNLFLKPIISFLTLPLTILTLGLFALVVNAGLVMLAAYLVPGVSIDTFLTALFFSLIVSVANAVLAIVR